MKYFSAVKVWFCNFLPTWFNECVHFPKKIESSANPEIRELKKIADGKSKKYWVIEGRKLFYEAIDSGIIPEKIFVTPEFWEEDSARLKSHKHAFLIPSRVMKGVTTVQTPPGILAIAERKSIPEIIEISGIALFVNSIRDPGNLGALIRSAEAAGCSFVACSSDSADPYSLKVLRASMGSLFRMPVFKISDTLKYLNAWKEKKIGTYALTPRSGTNLFEVSPKYPLLLIVGGETAGLPSGFKPDVLLTIPMKQQVESLNAAIAGSIAIFQLTKTQSK